jgi:methionyl-tRNA formyltransferase
LKILYWGTPAYAVPTLDALHGAGHELVGVVSQPDRRRGRGSQTQPSAVKARALELGLPVYSPERLRKEPEVQAQLAALGAEAFVVVAYGQILPATVLALPPLGCWNGHGSLLPRWRGAAPIQWALLEGDTQTGVGIMAMEEGLDTGAVLLERYLAIGLMDNAEAVSHALAQLTASLMLEALEAIEAGGPGPEPERLARLGVHQQSGQGMTYARLLQRHDFPIRWQRSDMEIHRQVMGLYPGAVAQWRGQRLKLLETEPLRPELFDQLSPQAQALVRSGSVPGDHGAPGQVTALVAGVGLVVATGDGSLLVRRGLLEGRRVGGGRLLLDQLQAQVGDRFDDVSPPSGPAA